MDSIETTGYFTITRIVNESEFSMMNEPDSFARYDLVIICESGGSSNSLNYGKQGANFPKPTLCLEPYAPTKSETDWFGANGISSVKGIETPTSTAGLLRVKAPDHEIMKNFSLAIDDTIRWTTEKNSGEADIDAHVRHVALDSLSIPDPQITNNATLLASNLCLEQNYNIPNNGFLWAVDENTTTHNRMVIMGMHSSFLKGVTNEFYQLMNYSAMWLCKITIVNSNDANLDSIYVDGNYLKGFHKDTLIYNYKIGSCRDSSDISHVVAYPTDINANVIINSADHAFDVTTITVTSADASSQKIYTIIFNFDNSSAYLDEIIVDGIDIFGFQANDFSYSIEYPYGSSVSYIPAVEASSSFECVTYKIDDAANLSDTTFITVYSADSSVVNIYDISYTIAEPGSVATLDSIMADSTSIEGFIPDSLGCYVVYVPEGNDVPNITCIPTDTSSSYEIIETDSIGGKTFIIVTAENGITTLTYCIEFRLVVNVNQLITGIAELYPTYVTNELNIELSNNTFLDGKIIISSIAGKQLINENINSYYTTIDCSNLASSMYFVIITRGSNRYTAKIIKK